MTPLNEDTQQTDSEGDPVLNTFQQFLSQSWYQNICNTTLVYNLPGRAIHAHFARDSKYGHLISDPQVMPYYLYKNTRGPCQWLPPHNGQTLLPGQWNYCS